MGDHFVSEASDGWDDCITMGRLIIHAEQAFCCEVGFIAPWYVLFWGGDITGRCGTTNDHFMFIGWFEWKKSVYFLLSFITWIYL